MTDTPMQRNEQRIIVVCGPDMTGKTEIAKALSEELGIPYFKASSEHDTYLNKKDRFIQELRFADTRMVDFLAQTGHSVVFDRAWPCEFAYSAAFNRETDMNVLGSVDTQFAALGALVVVCYRKSYEGIVDDIDKGITKDVLEILEEQYRGFAEWTDCHTLFLPVDDEDLCREVTDVLAWTGWMKVSPTGWSKDE